jgi:quercetin 2,3-dioxygenase
MIKTIPYNTLGHANHGWLDARHHFSFARYWNPERVGFGTLRVINDDKISARQGFGKHPHDNMEIITYVRSGAITHKDSLGNEGRTKAGDVQVMSAGSGVAHSEYNMEDEDTTLYQIWIEPNARNVKPRWDSREFPVTFANDSLPVLVSGRPEHEGKAAFIHQDATILGGRIKQGTTLSQAIKHQAYILAAKGRFEINGVALGQGDGAEVTNEKNIHIKALTDSELLIIDAP